ncbi:hypothetical protein U1Q18_014203, partial [Sarracenia purpurea var. burkii]
VKWYGLSVDDRTTSKARVSGDLVVVVRRRIGLGELGNRVRAGRLSLFRMVLAIINRSV